MACGDACTGEACIRIDIEVTNCPLGLEEAARRASLHWDRSMGEERSDERHLEGCVESLELSDASSSRLSHQKERDLHVRRVLLLASWNEQ